MRRLAALLILLATPAGAVELSLPPGAEITADSTESPAVVRIPTGPFADGALPADRLEGTLRLRAWRLPGIALPLAILRPIRAALEDQGWQPDFACAARECGGFDFRYAIRVVSTPAMDVDLADFHALTMTKGDLRLMLLVSRNADAGFVQLLELSPLLEVEPPAASTEEAVAGQSPAATPPPNDGRPETPPPDEGGLAAMLDRTGHAVLEGIAFETGSTHLAPGGDEAIAALAALMRDRPDIAVVLVGHSDNEGSLDGNIRVSRARAEAVRRALIDRPGIAADRVTAAGAGFLAPRASNATPEGRARNRRVEVVLR